MARYYTDCREHPSDIHCTVALSADTPEELLEAVIQHVVQAHGYEDTPAVRAEMESALKEGNPAS